MPFVDRGSTGAAMPCVCACVYVCTRVCMCMYVRVCVCVH